MFLVIFRTFGSRVGCLALIIFGLGYPWRFDWVGGAFLRQDWLAAVGMRRVPAQDEDASVSAGGAHRLRHHGAGLPGWIPRRPGGGLCPRTWSNDDPPPGSAVSPSASSSVSSLCLAAGSLTGAGPAAWTDFKWNLDKHHGTWLTNNVGLKNVLLYDGADHAPRGRRLQPARALDPLAGRR